jgi:Tfp pilus assembly protein PilF
MGNGDYDGAISDLTKAIEFDPHDPTAYNARGLAYQRKGELTTAHRDFSKAIDDFTKAIEHDPNNRLAHRNRALAYKKLGQPGKAQADFDAFLKLDNDRGDEFVALSTSARKPVDTMP